MKSTVLTTVTLAAVVSLATSWAMLYASKGGQEGDSQQELDSMAAQLALQANQIAHLEQTVRQLKHARVLDERSDARRAQLGTDDSTLSRLDQIERQLGQGAGAASPADVEEVQQTLGEQITSGPTPSSLSFERGEELFQSDYGAPMGGREKTLESVFRGDTADLAVESIQCKSSICRVVYRHPGNASSSDINAANDLLLMGITSGYGSGNVDVLQGTDSNGNQVMYIQER